MGSADALHLPAARSEPGAACPGSDRRRTRSAGERRERMSRDTSGGDPAPSGPRGGEGRAAARIRRASPLVLLLWVAASYAWTLPFGLTNDDFIWIYGASTSFGRPAAIVVPPAFGGTFLRPVVQASFALQSRLEATRPWAYRAANVAAHAGVTLLLWDVLRLLLATEGLPLLAAAAFAVHPSGAAAVVWVSGRTEVLCGLFYLAAVWAHLRRRRVAAALFFALALGSKESAASLPVLLAGLDWLRPGEREGSRARQLGRLWPYVAVLGVYLVARVVLLPEVAPMTFGLAAALRHPTFLHDKITHLGEYLLTPLPVHGFLLSLFLLIGLPLGALWCTRASPPPYAAAVRIGVFWTFATLLPYLPWFTFQPWYAYLPSMGVSVAVAATGADLLRREPSRRARQVASTAAVAAWLLACVVMLQVGNERERRAGERTESVLAALSRAVAPAQPRTVFVLAGLERDVLGEGPGLSGRPVLVAGMTEALRLRLVDSFVDVEYGGTREARLRAADRPVVLLEWSEPEQEFRRLWQSF